MASSTPPQTSCLWTSGPAATPPHTCKLICFPVSILPRYTLHFMFACGAFVAPLVARPFLRQATKILAVARSKLFRDEVEIAARDSWELWEIRSLYPMVGLTSLAVTPGYLICWMLERPKDKSKDVLVEKEDGTSVGIGCRRQITLKQSLKP